MSATAHENCVRCGRVVGEGAMQCYQPMSAECTSRVVDTLRARVAELTARRGFWKAVARRLRLHKWNYRQNWLRVRADDQRQEDGLRARIVELERIRDGLSEAHLFEREQRAQAQRERDEARAMLAEEAAGNEALIAQAAQYREAACTREAELDEARAEVARLETFMREVAVSADNSREQIIPDEWAELAERARAALARERETKP